MGVVAQPATKRSGDYKSGDVAWAKVVDRPWWPCIIFDSWDELAAWDLPTEIAEKPVVTARQVICCFLENYNLQVFDKENGAIRDWDDLELGERRTTTIAGPLARRRRRAISDAEVLIKLARGEIEDYEDDFATPQVTVAKVSRTSNGAAAEEDGGEGGKRPLVFHQSATRQHEVSKRARTATSPGSTEKPSEPSSWLDCLRLLIRMRPAHGLEIKNVVKHALEMATAAGNSDVATRLSGCISPPVYHDDDAGLCRIKALKILEEHDDAPVLSESSRRYLDALEGVGIEGDRPLPPSRPTRKKVTLRLDDDDDDAEESSEPHSLKNLVRTRAVAPGEIALEQPDGTVRADLRRDGLIAWSGGTYEDVETFVAAVREAHGLRAPRAASAKKLWDRIIHTATGKSLSELIPSPKPPPPVPTPPAPKKGNSAPATVPAEKATKSSSSKRKRSRPSSVKAETEHRRNGGEGKAAATSTTESGPSEDTTEEMEADASETPLSDYWKDEKVSSSQAAASVWDDGYFTDASDEDEKGNDAGGDEDENSFFVDAGKGQQQRTSSRQTSLRVRHIVDGLASNRLDPHALVGCEPYGDAAKGSGDRYLDDNNRRFEFSSTQPFSLTVHPDVAFLCDLHAHLAEAEIIGLLGGRWDATRRCMHVQAPFPCRATARDDDGATDVEMDPVSELEVREIIRRNDMDVVGWYHSHPKFAAEPSVTDIDNQRNYQQLFHDSESGLAPFIGLIVGTYDNATPSPSSVFRYFHVAPPPDSRQKQEVHRSPLVQEEEAEDVSSVVVAKDTSDEDVAIGESAMSAKGDVDLAGQNGVENENPLPMPPAVCEEDVETSTSSPAPAASPTMVCEDEVQNSTSSDPSPPVQEPRQPRASRRVIRRDEAPQNRRAPPMTPLIPMALNAKVRSYRRQLDDSAREDRRAAGPPEPPFSQDQPAALPFGFVNKACGFGCLCCPPKTSIGNASGTASESLKEPSNPEAPQATVEAAAIPVVTEAVEAVANPLETSTTKKSREDTVESICELVKELIQKADVGNTPAVEADAAWSKLEEQYGQTQLSCVAHTVRQLGKYYGQNERRVELSAHWRKDLSKWDKLLRSLTIWTMKMAVDVDKRADFLSDIFIYMQACWRSNKKKKRPPQPRSRR